MRSFSLLVLGLAATGFAGSASAQTVPRALPDRLDLTIERPDVSRAFLQLTFERTGETAQIVGCQTRVRNVGCRATRRIILDAQELAALTRRWRAFAAGARCRIRRPSGTWKPFTLEWTSQSVDGLVYERADEGLSARCFAIERIGGFFLRVWRDAAD